MACWREAVSEYLLKSQRSSAVFPKVTRATRSAFDPTFRFCTKVTMKLMTLFQLLHVVSRSLLKVGSLSQILPEISTRKQISSKAPQSVKAPERVVAELVGGPTVEDGVEGPTVEDGVDLDVGVVDAPVVDVG